MAATQPPYESIQAYCDAHIANHDEAAEAKAVGLCNTGIIFHAHMEGNAKWSDLVFSFVEGVQEPHLIWHLKDTPPHPEQHLGLHQILGISHGKQTEVLKGVDAPDAHLFTLHTTESAMNLEANSQSDINQLALGIFHNQKKAGTQILTFMSAGQTFAIHGQGETAPVTIAEGSVVYVKDAKELGTGSLQVFDKPLGTAGATMVLTFPVHTITMVSPGGIHPWLAEHRATGAIKNEPDNTFTITAPGGVDLHLEAPNRVTHDNWLNALTIYVQSYHAHVEAKAAAAANGTGAAVVAAAPVVAVAAASVPAVAEVQQQAPVVEKKAPESAPETKGSQAMLTRQPSQSNQAFVSGVTVASEQTAQPSAAVARSDGAAPRQVLIDGADFIAYFDTAVDGAPPQIVSRRLTVFYIPNDDASMGAIHWCDPTSGERTKRPDNKLPFGRISDVYLGKQHKIFQSKEAEGVDKQCAFSLMASKAWGLHLVADSPAIRAAWLNGIRDVFTNNGKLVSENAPGSGAAPIVQSAAVPASRGGEEKKANYIDFISKGSDVKVFFPAEAKPQKDKILPLTYGFVFNRHTDVVTPGFFIYWYPASKAFYWAPSRDQQATEGTKIKFSEISEIDTKTGWGNVPPDRQTGIIIRTTPEKGQFFLEASSPEERNRFLDGIKQLHLELDIEAKMASGDHANLEKELVPHNVAIFYDAPTPEGKGEGTLYYCHQGLRDRKPEHSIALSDVTDVFTGKLHAADKLLEKMVAQQNPKLDCLFTIRSATAQLILLAPDEPTRTAWLHGLKQAIEKYGGVVKAVAPKK